MVQDVESSPFPNLLEKAREKAPPNPEINKTINAIIDPYAQIFVTVLNSSVVNIRAVPAAREIPIEVWILIPNGIDNKVRA